MDTNIDQQYEAIDEILRSDDKIVKVKNFKNKLIEHSHSHSHRMPTTETAAQAIDAHSPFIKRKRIDWNKVAQSLSIPGQVMINEENMKYKFGKKNETPKSMPCSPRISPLSHKNEKM